MKSVWTVFQEPSGEWSAARVISFLATLSALLINLVYCLRNNTLPDGSAVLKEMIGTNLPYIVNKIGVVIKPAVK